MKQKLHKYLTKSSFCIKPLTIAIPLEEKTLKGLQILHISDLHIDTKTPLNEIQYLIDTINESVCDIVLFGGDIIDCKVEKIYTKLESFKTIKKPSYYVSGNHDLVYGYEKLDDIFKKYNIKRLDNRYEIIQYKQQNFVLWGLSDRFSKFFKIKRDETKLLDELNQIDLPKIMLCHQPKDYRWGLKAKSILALFGHTHGGQIYPFHYLVRLVQPFLKGLYFKDGMAIYVNSGIGAWGLKYRFLSQGEITLIEVA